MGVISQLSEVGLALGTGSYPAASAAITRGLIVSAFSCNPASGIDRVPETRGDLTTRRVTIPPIDRELSLSMFLDIGSNTSGSIGDFLASVFGQEVPINNGDGTYKHDFSMSKEAEPPWLNLFSNKDANGTATAKQYCGLRVGSLGLTINGAEGSIPIEIAGRVANEQTMVDQELAFSGEPLLLPSLATVSLGGAALTNFETIGITVESELEAIHPIGNSREISRLLRKSFKISGTLAGLQFANETERAKFLNVSQTSLLLTITQAVNKNLDISFQDIRYQTFEGPDIGDTDLSRLSLSFMATGSTGSNIISLSNTYNKRYDTGVTIP